MENKRKTNIFHNLTPLLGGAISRSRPCGWMEEGKRKGHGCLGGRTSPSVQSGMDTGGERKGIYKKANRPRVRVNVNLNKCWRTCYL